MPDKRTLKAPPPVSLVSGLPAEQRRAALDLFWSAFSRKLRFSLGPEERALRILARGIDPESTLCAIDAAGKLVGFAAIKSAARGFLNLTLTHFYQEYGIASGLLRALIMKQLDYKPADHELMIESLCVNETARGRGIGQMLLSHMQHAASQQNKQLILDVIADNSGARRLYAHRGFYETGRKNIGFLAPLFGFREVIRMQFTPHTPD